MGKKTVPADLPFWLLRGLPKDRPFTIVEAFVSLSFDYFNGSRVSVYGYAKLWGWSRKKVVNFLERAGFSMVRQRDTHEVQKQWGYLQKEQKRLNDDRHLEPPRDRKQDSYKGTEKGTETEQKRVSDNNQLDDSGDRRGDASSTRHFVSTREDYDDRPQGGDGRRFLSTDYVFVDGELFPTKVKVPEYLDEEGIKRRLREEAEKNG